MLHTLHWFSFPSRHNSRCWDQLIKLFMTWHPVALEVAPLSLQIHKDLFYPETLVIVLLYLASHWQNILSYGTSSLVCEMIQDLIFGSLG